VSSSVLVVDDDEDMRELLVHMLALDDSLRLATAAGAAEARAAILDGAFDVVVTDLNMPDGDGLSLMQWASDEGVSSSWIVLTGFGTLDHAVKALQLGAFDFISKPIQSAERVRSAVRNALEQRRLLRERDRLHGELAERNEQLQDHVEQLEEACGLLRDQAETIRADLRRAGAIQRSLLPEEAPELVGFHVEALYRPTQNVGGDLYDVIRVDDRHVALLLADAAGHGLSAAMLAVHFRSQLRLVDPAGRGPHPPAEVLRAVNRSLCESMPAPGLFLTAVYCLLDTVTREVAIASAGHPPVLRRSHAGGVERIRHTGPALGLRRDAEYSEHRVSLAPGDRLLLYSDGLYECVPESGDDMSGRIARALAADEAPDGAWSLAALKRCGRGLDDGGEPLLDDVTVLLLDTRPGVSRLDNGGTQSVEAAVTAGVDDRTLVGGDTRRVSFSVRGRGDWTHSAAFHVACAAAIEKGADLMLDLSECAQLDSTFLGTIHQLCSLADDAGVEFRLQGVLPPVEDLFVELGMQLVMDHIVPRMLPLPAAMDPVECAPIDAPTRALMLLRAHEGLAALSDRNRADFEPVLTQLRREFAVLTGVTDSTRRGTSG
jgi:sigma-B regulation protein RsbU (phosphoserine phosphatase)